MQNQVARFIEYTKSDYLLVDPTNDIVGFVVFDRDGEHIGIVHELLLDNTAPALRDHPSSRRVSLGIVRTRPNDDMVMVPFEAFGKVSPERREVFLNYPREFFEQERIRYRGLNYMDYDAAGNLYGFYEMDQDMFNERSGSDPDLTKDTSR